MTESPQELIAELGRQLGLPQLAWDGEGECALLFDDDLHAELRYSSDDGLLHLAAEVGALPVETAGDLLRRMAMANLDPGNLGLCHIALDRDTVVVGRCLASQDLTSGILIDALRQTVLTAKTWRSCLHGAV
ncbi:MAG: type III secretion system chaperone [Pseudomonadota bacterium]